MTVKLHLTERDSKGSKSDTALQDIAFRIAKAKKILAVTGAGVSCNAGIPDFRSADGLYNMVKKQYPGVVVKGKDLFDSVLFSSPETIQVFFTFMGHLRQCILSARATHTHKLLRVLKDKKKLLRCYTQNIDGLENQEELSTGISAQSWRTLDVVQLHGDIHKLKCMHCSTIVDWNEERVQECKQGEAPECPTCRIVQEDRARRNRRCTGVGRLRPNIVLYGEEHPDGDVIGKCAAADMRARPDFLLIAGTSLKVVGIQKLVRQAAKAVKARGGIVVFVNKSEVGQCSWTDVIDYHVEADCDEWVSNLKTRIPDFFAVQTSMTKFAVPPKTKAKSTAKVKAAPSAPATPDKARPDIVYIDDDEDDLMLTPPPSSRRTPRRARHSKNTENFAPAIGGGLPTPEKTPRRSAKSDLAPLGAWKGNRGNTSPANKRGLGEAEALEEAFAPIKRARQAA